MAPVRLGIIGVGQIGKHHLDNYKKIPGVEMVALADIDVPEGKRVSELYGIPNVYTDFRELLQRDDIQAVDVCLHNNLHAPVSIAVMEAGKDVYCEKPMAGSYRDAQAMYDASVALGRKLSIQLSTLYANETRAAKELIEGGHIGNVYHARSTGFRRRGRPYVDGYGTSCFVQKAIAGGGAFYDMGVYHIARMLWLMGQPAVQRISGKVYQETDYDMTRPDSAKYDVEELGMGFVKFANNLTLDIIESWAIQLDSFEGSSIVGNKGGIRLEPFGYFTSLGDFSLSSTVNLGETSYRWHQLRQDADAYDSSQHHWVAVQQGRVPLLPTAKLALDTMLISEGIYLSDRLGREVTAEEVVAMSVSSAIDPVMAPVGV
jgi:predicted dehydrogenase